MSWFARVLVVLWVALPAAWAGELRVVATVPDLAAIAAEVVKDQGTVTAMVLPTQDPHFLDARPSLALELSKADVLLAVGLDLEIGWLPNLQTGSRNPKIQKGAAGYLECAGFVNVLDRPTVAVDRSMGDVHPGGNPHYLYDPRNAIGVAMGVAQTLGRVDPEHAATYTANANDFAKRVAEAQVRWEAQLAPLKGKSFIGYHRSWTYINAWAGLTVAQHVEPRPGISPTPAHVVEVINAIAQTKASFILQEDYYPSTTSQVVATKAGIPLIRVPGGTHFQDGQTYIAHVDEVVALLAKAGQ